VRLPNGSSARIPYGAVYRRCASGTRTRLYGEHETNNKGKRYMFNFRVKLSWTIVRRSGFFNSSQSSFMKYEECVSLLLKANLPDAVEYNIIISVLVSPYKLIEGFKLKLSQNQYDTWLSLFGLFLAVNIIRWWLTLHDWVYIFTIDSCRVHATGTFFS